MTEQDRNELIKILQTIPILQGLQTGDLGKIIPLLESITYPAESVIIREGAKGDSMYVIVRGNVKVFRRKGGDTEIILSHLSDGAYFGELTLIDELPRSADIVTLEETEVLRLTRINLDRLLSDNRDIAVIFYRNCLTETFSRFRHNLSSFTFAQFDLNQKSAILEVLNEDLSHARKVQNYFIDTLLLDSERDILPGIRQSYVYRPCIDVGGDFLNITRLNDRQAGVIIADIEGHGITASLGTGVLKSALSMIMNEMGSRPVDVLRFLNTHFNLVIPNLYATCYYSVIDTEKNRVFLSKAGHHHPIYWKSRRKDFITIECSGIGLGIMKDAHFGEVTLDVEKGDRLLFYTDGIIEQFNEKQEMYGRTRLLEKLRDLILADATNIPELILEDLKTFAGKDEFDDDVTMLLLEF